MSKENLSIKANSTSNSLKEIGSRMDDGTIYVGASNNTGKHVFIMPEDSPRAQWQEAMEYAANLEACGHKDWRVPTREDLDLIQKSFDSRYAFNSNHTEGFDRGTFARCTYYWSSEESFLGKAWAKDLDNGPLGLGRKRWNKFRKEKNELSVRLVRDEHPKP